MLLNKDYKNLKDGTYTKEYVINLINKLEYKYVAALYGSLHAKYIDDLDVSIAISENAPSLYKYFPYEHRNHKPIIKNCVHINTDIYMYINDENKADKDVILWCSKNKWMRASRLAENFLKDEDIAYKFCIKAPSNIKIFKTYYNDEQFIRRIMKKNHNVYQYISDELKNKDDFVDLFISKSLSLFIIAEAVPANKIFERHNLIKIQEMFPEDFKNTPMENKLKNYEREDKLLNDMDIENQISVNKKKKL